MGVAFMLTARYDLIIKSDLTDIIQSQEYNKKLSKSEHKLIYYNSSCVQYRRVSLYKQQNKMKQRNYFSKLYGLSFTEVAAGCDLKEY